jgi:hypothetical protein
MGAPEDAEAVSRVWHGTYHMLMPPPEVRFFLDTQSGYWAQKTDGYSESSTAYVRRDPPNKPLHETALSHELFHFALAQRTGNSDPWHSVAGWENTPGSILDGVDAANAMLKARGQ